MRIFIVCNMVELNVAESTGIFNSTEWAIPFLKLGGTTCSHLMNDTLSHDDEQPLWNCHVYLDVTYI